MTQAYYRKWRPQTWDEVIGQEHVISTLRNAVHAGLPCLGGDEEDTGLAPTAVSWLTEPAVEHLHALGKDPDWRAARGGRSYR